MKRWKQKTTYPQWYNLFSWGFLTVQTFKGYYLGVFSIIYIIILTGNSLIIILTRLDPTLQKPMYFFLANFSSLEICSVSVTLPRILVNLWTQDRSISVLDCAAQTCFFLILWATECFLLAVMACDCCVAICGPLHCPLVMTPKVCLQLAVGSGSVESQCRQGKCARSSLCTSVIRTRLTTSVTSPYSEAGLQRHFCTWALSLCSNSVVCCCTFMLILASYSKIISTILRSPTARGRAKAFSTSHLLVVLLFFGPATIAYLRPKSSHSAGTDRLLSLFYSIVTPMFNPMIYRSLEQGYDCSTEKIIT